MCRKNIWKYMLLLSISSLVVQLFYLLFSLFWRENSKIVGWENYWLHLNILFLLISVKLGVITNIKTMTKEINKFLKC